MWSFDNVRGRVWKQEIEEETCVLIQARGDMGLTKQDSDQGRQGGRWEKYFGPSIHPTWRLAGRVGKEELYTDSQIPDSLRDLDSKGDPQEWERIWAGEEGEFRFEPADLTGEKSKRKCSAGFWVCMATDTEDRVGRGGPGPTLAGEALERSFSQGHGSDRMTVLRAEPRGACQGCDMSGMSGMVTRRMHDVYKAEFRDIEGAPLNERTQILGRRWWSACLMQQESLERNV